MMGLPAGTSSPITSNDEFYAFAEEETCRNITLGESGLAISKTFPII